MWPAPEHLESVLLTGVAMGKPVRWEQAGSRKGLREANLGSGAAQLAGAHSPALLTGVTLSSWSLSELEAGAQSWGEKPHRFSGGLSCPEA